MSKVLVVTESLSNPVGGPYWSVKSTVATLLSKGHDIVVFGSRDKFSQPFFPTQYVDLKDSYTNLQVFAFKKIGPQNLHLTPALLFKLLTFKRVDTILLQGPWTWNCWVVFMWGKIKGIPVYMSIRGEFVDSKSVSKLKKRPFLPWVFFMMRHLNGIHVLNRHEIAAIRSYKIYTRCEIIPNGVHISLNTQKLNKEPILLYLGKLHPDKNVINLILGWKSVPAKGNWKLVIAGSGESTYVNQIKKTIGDCNDIEMIGR